MGLIASSKWHPPHDPEVSFSGKTILVTGSNTGVGLAAAKKYASHGAKKIILAVRNLEKGEKAKAEVAKCAVGNVLIEVRKLDMSRFSGVKDFVSQLISDLKEEPLDIALLNAGVTSMTPHPGQEGFDELIQVNTLSTVLLAILLLPKLKESKRQDSTPTLTFTSSQMVLGVSPSTMQVSPTDPNSETPFLSYWSNPGSKYGPTAWPIQRLYSISKVLVEFAIDELCTKVVPQDPATKDVDVIINSCCPGLCNTDLSRDFTSNSFFFLLVTRAAGVALLRTPEQGSRTLVSATTLGLESHGKLWSNDKIIEKNRGILDSPERGEIQGRIWKEMITIFRRVAPESEAILGLNGHEHRG